jgi:hypothetical protein
VASSNAPLVKFSVGATRSWIEANIFDLGGEVNSYLRANVAQPYRFTLGGSHSGSQAHPPGRRLQ